MLRITAKMMLDHNLSNLNTSQARLAELQDRLVTGKRLGRPSDAPHDLPRALSLRADLARSGQFVRNIEDGITRLTMADTALGSVTDVLQRAKELAIQGSSPTLSQTERDNIATEVDELLNEAVAVGNTTLAGQYIFGGHQTLAPPFTPVGTPPSSVTYGGDSGVIERTVSVGARVQVNVAGDQALSSTFSALISMRDNLSNGDTTALRTSDLTALDGALDNVLQVRGALGSRTNRLELSLNRLQATIVDTQEQRSKIEDADLVETIVEQNAQQMMLEAALATMARSLDTTLLNFLR